MAFPGRGAAHRKSDVSDLATFGVLHRRSGAVTHKGLTVERSRISGAPFHAAPHPGQEKAPARMPGLQFNSRQLVAIHVAVALHSVVVTQVMTVSVSIVIGIRVIRSRAGINPERSHAYADGRAVVICVGVVWSRITLMISIPGHCRGGEHSRKC